MSNRNRLLCFVTGLLLASFVLAEERSDSSAPPFGLTRQLWKSFAEEARRYGQDSVALIVAPGSWKKDDVQRAAAIVLVLGGFMLADRDLDREAQNARSTFTDEVSRQTTGFGGRASVYLSAGLLVSGAVFRNGELRETGRDALEASLITHLLMKHVLKPAFGRVRPEDSRGETIYHPFSHHSSFPSAHATQAFAFASVVAARSKGWLVPAIAYSAATIVALDRVNDRAHFASDVFAGAVLGTVTGRFLVRRHREASHEPEQVSVEPTVTLYGVGVQIRF